MLLSRFPELATLKRRLEVTPQWPSVLLSVEARGVYRPDIRGPLSVFANYSGTSSVRAGDFATRVPEGTFALTNAGDRYTLEIEGEARTQNLHVGDAVAPAVYRALVTPDDRLLDEPDVPGASIRFLPRLYPRDALFEAHYARVFRTAAEEPQALDEAIAGLLVYLLGVHREGLREAARVPAVRPATRAELHRRLARAVDLAHAAYVEPLSLDDLAEAACLSKYHFLRLFRGVYGQTPHRYVTGVRMRAAQRLLRTTALQVAEVGLAVGYEEPSVFSRTFRQHVGASPLRFRAAA